MMDNTQAVIKRMNWSMIGREVKKLGLDIDSEIRELVNTLTQDKIEALFAFLANFERGGGCSRLQHALLNYQAPPLISMSPADQVPDMIDEEEMLIEQCL
jgi:hypothetical protein